MNTRTLAIDAGGTALFTQPEIVKKSTKTYQGCEFTL